MTWLAEMGAALLDLALAVAPWLLLGLVLAGLVRALLPISLTRRILSGSGMGAMVGAALVGAPLPLCSCGAIPAALELRRQGAGRGPATAFLVSTPGIGVDSVILTSVLLGPPMAVARAIAAAVVAVVTGFAVGPGAHGQSARGATSGCCGDACAGDGVEARGADVGPPLRTRLADGLVYAFTDMLDDIAVWMAVGLAVAAFVMTAVPPEALAVHGTGLIAMAVVAVTGLVMYICATAATPIAGALIASGLSPGTALVFLLAAPITSLATLAVLRAEFGWAYLLRYVAATVLGSIAAGLVVDALFARIPVAVTVTSGGAPELIPQPIAYGALGVLGVAMIPPVRRVVAQTVRFFRPRGRVA